VAALGFLVVAVAAALALHIVGVDSASAASRRDVRTARRQMPNPVRIVIPSIGVDARIVPLGLNRDQTMQVPKDLLDAGWFAPGPEPGEQGAAVIVGHVNGRRGAGVFARLWKLRAGDFIKVEVLGGSAVTFVARSMLRVAKTRFPTNRVYARTEHPTLRLITCAGKLNQATGHHALNRIVFAVLPSARR
jgi:LPXTG-site transpeptidase (sortase) family protein